VASITAAFPFRNTVVEESQF